METAFQFQNEREQYWEETEMKGGKRREEKRREEKRREEKRREEKVVMGATKVCECNITLTQ